MMHGETCLAQPKPDTDIDVILFENAAEKSHDPMPLCPPHVVLACKFIPKSDSDDYIALHSTILDSWFSNASMAFYSAAAGCCASSSSMASPTAIRTFRPARSTFRRRVFRALNGWLRARGLPVNVYSSAKQQSE